MPARPKFVPRPSRVDIAHTHYDIRWLEDSEWKAAENQDDERGVCKHVPHVIDIRLGMDDQGRFPDRMLREVLLHEILHAAFAVSFLWNVWQQLDRDAVKEWDKVEEIIVGATTVPLLQVLNQNPGVLAYLLDDQEHD
jgi:hypothetical protein